MSPLPVYGGQFTAKEATRLLWRSGFGPGPGEVTAIVAKGTASAAVDSLFAVKKEKLKGKAPKLEGNRPIKPRDRYGHDHLWFLDRMVRSTKPIVERMTLIWHDWFATSNDGVGSQTLMLAQNETFRKYGLGSFLTLVTQVTRDPAMLLWLSGADSTADDPNENYGRELMELFTLGAETGSYTEHDVRQQARALTGWTYRWSNKGPTKFHFEPDRHDDGTKDIFSHAPFNVAPGNWTWTDSPRLCVQHPNHPKFFVKKLWSYFIPTPPSPSDQAALETLYEQGADEGPQYGIAEVVKAILKHPDLYLGESMIKPPVVYTAGLLRALGRTIDTYDWIWLDNQAGQQLFYPPNVAGWDDSRWLDTASFKGRWDIANFALRPTSLDPDHDMTRATIPTTADALVAKALAAVGAPALEPGAQTILLDFAQTSLDGAGDADQLRYFAVMVYNGLRHLIVALPEAQTS